MDLVLMEKRLNSPLCIPSLSLQGFKLRLNTGKNIRDLYCKLINQQTGISPVHSIHAQSTKNGTISPVLAAPIKSYVNTPLVCRVHDIVAQLMRPLFSQAKENNIPIHIHLPDKATPQSHVINEKTYRIFFNDYYPGVTLHFTTGSYLTALKRLTKNINELISGAIDCQTDNQTLKKLASAKTIMTALDDTHQAAGEGCVFLHLNKNKAQLAKLFLMPKPSNIKTLQSQLNTLTKNNLMTHHLVYPQQRNLTAINHLLELERVFKHQPTWLSPESMCGNLGVATMPTCILLAYVDACQNQQTHQGLCIDPANHAGLITIEKQDE